MPRPRATRIRDRSVVGGGRVEAGRVTLSSEQTPFGGLLRYFGIRLIRLNGRLGMVRSGKGSGVGAERDGTVRERRKRSRNEERILSGVVLCFVVCFFSWGSDGERRVCRPVGESALSFDCRWSGGLSLCLL